MIATFLALLFSLVAYGIAKYINKTWLNKIPTIIIAMAILLILVVISGQSYHQYMHQVDLIFEHLLGYATVALAIPLASMRLNDLPLKPICMLLLFASVSAVLLAMGLAYFAHLSDEMILAFSTRAVTTPIALNIAALIHSPLVLTSMIVVLSGTVGAAFSPWLLKNVDDERAAGLALGLAAHAIGTVQAWQRSPTAGRYATFAMTLNAVLTAIWLPPTIHFLQQLT